ncbi:MAG: pilus assembly protein [Methanobacteriaceae archaeon]
MDQRGQISIEFVLVVALMLPIVLLVGSYIGDQNEINTVTTAARTGAMDAVTDLAILNRSMEPLRVKDVRMSENGQNLTLLINVSGPISDSANRTILNASIQSIAAQVGRNVTNNVVVTGRRTYSVEIV